MSAQTLLRTVLRVHEQQSYYQPESQDVRGRHYIEGIQDETVCIQFRTEVIVKNSIIFIIVIII